MNMYNKYRLEILQQSGMHTAELIAENEVHAEILYNQFSSGLGFDYFKILSIEFLRAATETECNENGVFITLNK